MSGEREHRAEEGFVIVLALATRTRRELSGAHSKKITVGKVAKGRREYILASQLKRAVQCIYCVYCPKGESVLSLSLFQALQFIIASPPSACPKAAKGEADMRIYIPSLSLRLTFRHCNGELADTHSHAHEHTLSQKLSLYSVSEICSLDNRPTERASASSGASSLAVAVAVAS